MTRSVILCALVVSQTAFSREVPFDDLLSNPVRYNKQQISVTGIAKVVGDNFALWRDERAIKQMDLKHQIDIDQKLGLPSYPGLNVSRYSPANLHWVRVTGTVDTNWRGRLGLEPFGVRLTRVQILPGPRLKKFLNDAIWLKNDTKHELTVEIESKLGGMESKIEPGEVFLDEIDPRPTARVKLTLGYELFARLQLVPAFAKRYYDPDKHAYYCRITEGKATFVAPPDAKGWNFHPTPWRD